MEINDEPRFLRGVDLFNAGEYLEASDCFEDLFFEGVRDEPDFIRIFLQFSVGIHHAQTGQWRPAVERIEEGLRLVASNRDDRGIDLLALASGMKAGARQVRASARPEWPRIERRQDPAKILE
jgi:predicted metal-dependent hydrolase